MTFYDTVDHLYNLSINGYFNGEKFTRIEFACALKRWLEKANFAIMEIQLPDGRWMCEVTKHKHGQKIAFCCSYISKSIANTAFQEILTSGQIGQKLHAATAAEKIGPASGAMTKDAGPCKPARSCSSSRLCIAKAPILLRSLLAAHYIAST